MNGIITLLLLGGLTLNTANIQNFEKVEEKIENEDKCKNHLSLNDNQNQLYSIYYGDKFEPNDNISNATEICPHDFYARDNYSVTVNATLDYTSFFQDVDYYYITLFTESNITINISSDYDYSGNFQFAFLKYDYFNISDGYAYHQPLDIYSNYNGVRNISYTNSLNGGTYLIYLRGCQDSQNSHDISYTLNVDIKKINYQEDILTNDLTKNTNLLGAAWISNFLPCDNKSLFDITSDYVYFKESETNLDYPDYALDKMREVSNGEPIRVATFYIWDKVLRYALHDLTNQSIIELLDSAEVKDEKTIQLMIRKNVITSFLEIIAIVGDKILKSTKVQLASKILSYLGETTIIKYFNSIMPTTTQNEREYGVYLGKLSELFNISLPDKYKNDEKNLVDNIYKYGENKIVEVPIYYNLGIKKNSVSTNNEYYYSLKASNTVCSRIDSLSYTKDYFIVNQTNDYYCGGKIYQISRNDKLTDCSTFKLAKSHTHVYENHYCIYCNKYTPDHDFNSKCTWISPTSHKAVCGCGVVANKPHVVRNGSSNCILCGGKVDKGFIQVNYMRCSVVQVSENGSYILNNGIIVLMEEDEKLFFEDKLVFFDNKNTLIK